MRRLLSGLTALAVGATLLLIVAPADAATRYTVTAYASIANGDVGERFILKGRVTPSASGQRVLVQRWNGSTWITLKRAPLNRYSRYSTTVRVAAPGDNRFRVVKPRSNGHPRGVSPVRTVVGWRWRSVGSLPRAVAVEHTTFPASGVLLDNAYAPFIKQGGTGATGVAKFRLDGRCAQFESVAGVTSDSLVAPDEATIAVLAHYTGLPDAAEPIAEVSGQTKSDEPVFIRRGPAVMSTVAVLVLEGGDLAAGNYVGWGNPRVYCRS